MVLKLVSRFKRGRTILFVRPDYHCSFFYKDELRKRGWSADIFVPRGYPEKLLYRDSDVLRAPSADKVKSTPARQALEHFMSSLWYLANGWKYEFHIYYGPPPVWFNLRTKVTPHGTPGYSLWLAKLWGSKLVFLPTGCREELSKQEFESLDDGTVCGNCGFWDRCSDQENLRHFSTIRRYFDGVIGLGFTPPTQFPTTHLKWKSIDLQLWKPGLSIPRERRLPPTNAIRILHSFSSNGRSFGGRNIKGSPLVIAAVERLKSEGHKVELIYLTDVPSNQMRFYQAQADIIVEQLRYGWWGSTGVETMALGKPVICYLRSSWKKLFLDTFPEYDTLPIVEADAANIYSVLRNLVIDEKARAIAGEESRKFAERHFNPAENAEALERYLLTLK